MKRKIRTVSASAAGRGHVRSGKACDDAVETCSPSRFWAIAVLADGAGTANCGGEAARVAVATTMAEVKAAVKSTGVCSADVLRNAMSVASSVLETFAAKRKMGIREWGTTLMLTCAKLNGDMLHYWIAHVGDGCIVAATESTGLTLSKPKRGEHANETYFLTERNLVEHAYFDAGVLDASHALMLMSDGTASCLYDYRKSSPAKGCSLLSGWAGRLKKSRLQRVVSRNVADVFTEYSNDDCSIAIVRPIGVSSGQHRK